MSETTFTAKDEIITHSKGGHHFALFFSVDEVVVVLHRDEWRQVVGDGVIWKAKSQHARVQNEEAGAYFA
jgi:hypothetical protein